MAPAAAVASCGSGDTQLQGPRALQNRSVAGQPRRGTVALATVGAGFVAGVSVFLGAAFARIAGVCCKVLRSVLWFLQQ